MFLVIIHELWHYRTARWSKVKILEFGVWIPPKVVKLYTDALWTEWTLNWIPLWWFVRLKWEDPTHEEFLEKDSFIMARLRHKILILLWWVIMNFIFAWIALVIVFFIWVKPIQLLPDNYLQKDIKSLLIPTYSYARTMWLLSWDDSQIPARITQVMSGELWQKTGLMSGDIIMSVWSSSVNSITVTKALQGVIGQTTSLLIDRQWQTLTLPLVCPDDNCLLGIWIEQGMIEINQIKYSFNQAVVLWSREFVAQTKMTRYGLAKLWSQLFSFDLKKAQQWVAKMSWPAAIVKISQSIMDRGGRAQLLAFAALISLNLAVFNLLPIPALDWGRLLSVIIQAIWRFKPSSYFVIEWWINTVFFVALMWLGLIVLFNDLHKIWGLW
jgi:membrane-associated protease RseP (regulator of RpoE activity)